MKDCLSFKNVILKEEDKLISLKNQIISLAQENNVNFEDEFKRGKELYILKFETLTNKYEYTFLDSNILKKIDNMIRKYNDDFRELINDKMDELGFTYNDKWKFTTPVVIGVNTGIFDVSTYRDSLEIRKEDEVVLDSNEKECPYCGGGGCFQCESSRFITGIIYY